MDKFLRRDSHWLGGVLVAVVLLCSAPSARAEAPSATTAGAVFAEARSFTSFITNGSARDRVVQIAVLCMAVALFILMKKFVPDGSTAPRSSVRSRPADLSQERTPPSRKV
jgi:hypothetical protein